MFTHRYFKDRKQAGELLAAKLFPKWSEREPLVLGLPRGGVPVAYSIARKLRAPLDILLVRKIGAPLNPEYALGAIAEDGQVWLNPEAAQYGMPDDFLMGDSYKAAVLEMKRQEQVFRGSRRSLPVQNRPIILVDDGLATGATMLAAIASLKQREASSITVAVPVASREARRLVEAEVDQIHVLLEPESFGSVGEWYESFKQVSDEEVLDLLQADRKNLIGTFNR